jgi:hypothetical protein
MGGKLAQNAIFTLISVEGCVVGCNSFNNFMVQTENVLVQVYKSSFFRLFDSFRARLELFKKCWYDQSKNVSKNGDMAIKKGEFYAEFETVEKAAEKFLQKLPVWKYESFVVFHVIVLCARILGSKIKINIL